MLFFLTVLLIQASTGGRFLGVHSIGVINYIFVESLWNIDYVSIDATDEQNYTESLWNTD